MRAGEGMHGGRCLAQRAHAREAQCWPLMGPADALQLKLLSLRAPYTEWGWPVASKANASLFWGDPVLRRSMVLAYMGLHASGAGNGTWVRASLEAICVRSKDSILISG